MAKPKFLNVKVTLTRIVALAKWIREHPEHNPLCEAAHDELQSIAFIARATLENHARKQTRKDVRLEV